MSDSHNGTSASDAASDGEPERKTLQQQLKENRERKHREYKQVMESQNSSYKLDERSARFYETLREKELREELDQKIEETNELDKFRRLKRAVNTSSAKVEKPVSSKVSISISRGVVNTKIGKLPKSKPFSTSTSTSTSTNSNSQNNSSNNSPGNSSPENKPQGSLSELRSKRQDTPLDLVSGYSSDDGEEGG